MPDLFAIVCTTCKSRLRVRDANILGQILACPKCQSMVLVEPPPGWEPTVTAAEMTPAGTASSSAILGSITSTQAFVAKPTLPLPTAPPRNTPVSPLDPTSLKETKPDGEFGEVVSMFSDQPSPALKAMAIKSEAKQKSPSNKLKPPPPGEMVADVRPAAALPINASATAVVKHDRHAAHGKRWQLWSMLAAGGLLGIALAIGFAYSAANWVRVGRNKVAEAPPTPSVNPSEAPPIENKDPTPAQPDEVKPQVPAEKTREPMPDKGIETVKPETIQPELEKTKPPEKTKPTDPLGIVDDPPVKPTEDASDIASLRKFSELIPSDEDSTLNATETTEKPTEPTAEAPPPAERVESRPRPEREKIDVTARLADKLLSISFEDRPLNETMQFISGMSRIPITIEPEALAWAKITPRQPVKVTLGETTVKALLEETLRPLKLEPQVVGDHVVVTRSSALRTINYPVDDLTGGKPEELTQLTELVRTLAAPLSWKEAGGAGSIRTAGNALSIENTELAHGQVVELMERLRVARGGRPRSSFPPEWFSLEKRTERAASKLDHLLSLNYSQPTLLSKILDRFGAEAGVGIVVDWRALDEAGWPPDIDATVTVTKVPLRDALRQLLIPMDLTYRVIDAGIIQVTTPQALELRPEIEIHPAKLLVSGNSDGDALVQRIVAALGPGSFRESGGSGAVVYDTKSNSIIALLPQPKQIELARLLAEWAK